MGKIKAFLIAVCLLSVSQFSMAFTVAFPGDVPGSTASYIVDDFEVIGGPAFAFSATGSGFVDIRNLLDSPVNVVIEASSTQGATPQPIQVAFFEDNAAEGGTIGTLDALDTVLLPLTEPSLGFTFSWLLDPFLEGEGAPLDNLYFLEFLTTENSSINITVSPVPVPAAGILFATALLGAGALSRRKKKTANSAVVGAFARAS